MHHLRVLPSIILALAVAGGSGSLSPVSRGAQAAQTDAKQSKAAVKIADEDPEVAAYFKSKGWSLQNDVRISDFKRLNFLNVEKAGSFFEVVDLTPDDYKMIARSKSLQVLNLIKAKTTDAGLKTVAGIPQMENIILKGEGVTDAGMKALASSPALETVVLFDLKNVTDAGIKELAALPKLKTLNVSNCTFNGSAFEGFAGSKTLEAVELSSDKNLTDDGIKHLAKVNLNNLKITFCGDKVTAAGIRAIVAAHLPATFEFDKKLIDDDLLATLLEKGWLYGPTPPGSSVRKPATAKDVTSLALSDSKVTDKGFEKLLPCVNVQYLFLERTSIGDETFKKLGGFKKLSYLSLTGTKATAAGLEAIAGLPIKHLGLEECELSEAAFQALGKMTSLEELWLGNAKLKGEWLKHIATLPKLKDLSLTSTDFSNDAAKHLSTLATLEKLNLQYTQLGDSGFQELVKLPKLRSFALDGTKVTKEVFQKAKQDHPKLYLQNIGLDR